jgi:hypothetical protein
MAGIAASWRTIEGVLWENAHSVYRALRKPATATRVARLAKLLPAKLPRENKMPRRRRDLVVGALLPWSGRVTVTGWSDTPAALRAIEGQRLPSGRRG